MSDFPKLRNGLVLEIPGARNGSGLMSSCLNCCYFDELGQTYTGEITDKNRTKRQPETCAKFEARPPARVIAFGCPDYEDEDSIPF